jgi:hypothetical protein
MRFSSEEGASERDAIAGAFLTARDPFLNRAGLEEGAF